MSYHIEHTDTFGGEANYCWVNRFTFNGTEKQAIKAAKAAIGWTGAKCKRSNLGGYGWEYRIPGVCQVLFVTWADEAAPVFGKTIGVDGHPIEAPVLGEALHASVA